MHFLSLLQKTETTLAFDSFVYFCLFLVWLEGDGVTYDAYTLDRWSVAERSDEMQQQTPSRVGEPWIKVTSLGTNMKQIVSGPDGNPLGTFSG